MCPCPRHTRKQAPRSAFLKRSGNQGQSNFKTERLELEHDEQPPRIAQHHKPSQVKIQTLSLVGLPVSYAPVFHSSLQLFINSFLIHKGIHKIVLYFYGRDETQKDSSPIRVIPPCIRVNYKGAGLGDSLWEPP